MQSFASLDAHDKLSCAGVKGAIHRAVAEEALERTGGAAAPQLQEADNISAAPPTATPSLLPMSAPSAKPKPTPSAKNTKGLPR